MLRGVPLVGFAYNLKAIADYETGPGAEVSPQMAADAIEKARRFVAKVAHRAEDAGGMPS